MSITHKTINDIGLQFFQWIKKVKGDNVNYEDISKENTKPLDHMPWNKLLLQHINEDGWIDYQGFINNKGEFNEYLGSISNNPPSNNWSEDEKMAYWINAYNAFTIKLILDYYPVQSIKDIGGKFPMINSPWDIKFFKIGGVDFDLNTIEHDILRREFNDPRIHFAINCASISCPVLRREAYQSEILDDQLEDQARKFINDPLRNQINAENIRISKIFDWFKSDFTEREDIISYLNKYSNYQVKENAEIKFLDYDWSLNEQ